MSDAILFLTLYIKVASVWVLFLVYFLVTEFLLLSNCWNVLVWLQYINPNPLSAIPTEMVKHTQAIRWLLPKNCLSVFDHFVGSAL